MFGCTLQVLDYKLNFFTQLLIMDAFFEWVILVVVVMLLDSSFDESSMSNAANESERGKKTTS